MATGVHRLAVALQRDSISSQAQGLRPDENSSNSPEEVFETESHEIEHLIAFNEAVFQSDDENDDDFELDSVQSDSSTHNDNEKYNIEEEEFNNLDQPDRLLSLIDTSWDAAKSKSFRHGKFAPFNSDLEYSLTCLFGNIGVGSFSRKQEEAVLRAFSATCTTPSHSRLVAIRKDLRSLLNIFPVQKTILGKSIHYIPIQTSIRLAFANPKIRKSLHVYPRKSDTIAELYETEKWIFEIPSPMVRQTMTNGKFFDYYAGEAYYIENNANPKALIVPQTFFENQDGSLWAFGNFGQEIDDVSIEIFDEEGAVGVTLMLPFLVRPETVICTEHFDTYIVKSIKDGSNIRLKANGLQVFSVPITLFNDDTSGNISKKWNKYESWEFTLAGLSYSMNQNLENIYFICTSNTISAAESAVIVSDCLRELRNGIKVYDSSLKTYVIVIVSVIQFVGDNPAVSAGLSHLGTSSLTPCRICVIWSPDDAERAVAFLTDPSGKVGLRSFKETKSILERTSSQLLRKEITKIKAAATLKQSGIKDFFFS
ncbi:hypothetical protein HDU99_004765, partial [Rhizoclosmatium hyalinum]